MSSIRFPGFAAFTALATWLAKFNLIQLAIIIFAIYSLVSWGFSNNTFLNIFSEQLFNTWYQASTFVLLTLSVIYGLEKIFSFDLGQALRKHRKWQLPLATVLGATPGCGGAITVVLQFLRGNVSFGCLVAALTATMGDSAFLLLAARPLPAIVIIVIQIGAAYLTGALVERFTNHKFAIKHTDDTPLASSSIESNQSAHGFRLAIANVATALWWLLAIPGVVITIMMVTGSVNDDYTFGAPLTIAGIAGGLLCILFWLLRDSSLQHDHAQLNRDASLMVIANRIVAETCYISAWVLVSFLLYAGFVLMGLDLPSLFNTFAAIIPLVAILVGFIPGCGPQLVVATMYISNLIPFSAQLGNAIANDGDAMLPAFSVAPRATILATLYSALPALLLAYLAYFLLAL